MKTYPPNMIPATHKDQADIQSQGVSSKTIPRAINHVVAGGKSSWGNVSSSQCQDSAEEHPQGQSRSSHKATAAVSHISTDVPISQTRQQLPHNVSPPQIDNFFQNSNAPKVKVEEPVGDANDNNVHYGINHQGKQNEAMEQDYDDQIVTMVPKEEPIDSNSTTFHTKAVKNEENGESKTEEIIPFNETENLDIKRKGSTNVCAVCGKFCKDKYAFKVHMLVHTGEKPFECLICPKRFARSDQLKAHTRIHTGDTFVCLICPKKFTTSSNLKVHTRIHTGDTFDCSECPRKFTNSEKLERHTSIHTGEKLFQCLYCLKRFSRSDHLNRHMVKCSGTPPLTDAIPMSQEEPFHISPLVPEKFDTHNNNGSAASISENLLLRKGKMSTSSTETISIVANKINVTKTIADRAEELFGTVRGGKKMKLKGRSSDCLALACLYIACRQEGAPRTFKEMAAGSSVSKKEIIKCFKLILKVHGTKLDLITAADFMQRFCGTLGLAGDIEEAASFIAKKATDLYVVLGRSPRSVAAASIYMASQASADRRTVREIGEVAKVNYLTIRQCYKLMLQRAPEIFPIDFQFVTPIKYLPLN